MSWGERSSSERRVTVCFRRTEVAELVEWYRAHGNLYGCGQPSLSDAVRAAVRKTLRQTPPAVSDAARAESDASSRVRRAAAGRRCAMADSSKPCWGRDPERTCKRAGGRVACDADGTPTCDKCYPWCVAHRDDPVVHEWLSRGGVPPEWRAWDISYAWLEMWYGPYRFWLQLTGWRRG